MEKNKIESEKLFISIAIPLIVGFISSIWVNLDWYSALNKPFFTPPNWIFMPVWTVLYILMGISYYLIWIKVDKATSYQSTVAHTIYLCQLALNFAWTIVFFGLQEIMGGVVILFLLIPFVLVTIDAFRVIDKKASNLLLPYLVWLCFALFLNLGILVLN